MKKIFIYTVAQLILIGITPSVVAKTPHDIIVRPAVYVIKIAEKATMNMIAGIQSSLPETSDVTCQKASDVIKQAMNTYDMEVVPSHNPMNISTSKGMNAYTVLIVGAIGNNSKDIHDHHSYNLYVSNITADTEDEAKEKSKKVIQTLKFTRYEPWDSTDPFFNGDGYVSEGIGICYYTTNSDWSDFDHNQLGKTGVTIRIQNRLP